VGDIEEMFIEELMVVFLFLFFYFWDGHDWMTLKEDVLSTNKGMEWERIT